MSSYGSQFQTIFGGGQGDTRRNLDPRFSSIYVQESLSCTVLAQSQSLTDRQTDRHRSRGNRRNAAKMRFAYKVNVASLMIFRLFDDTFQAKMAFMKFVLLACLLADAIIGMIRSCSVIILAQ